MDISSSSEGLTFTIGQMTTSDRRTITFSPFGEATTNASPSAFTGFDPRIGIGLRQTRGTSLVTNTAIAVVVDGSVGLPTIYRKQ